MNGRDEMIKKMVREESQRKGKTGNGGDKKVYGRKDRQ